MLYTQAVTDMYFNMRWRYKTAGCKTAKPKHNLLTCPKSCDRKDSSIYSIPPTSNKYHLWLSAIIFGAGSIQLLRMEWPQGGQRGGGGVTNEAKSGGVQLWKFPFLGLETVAYTSESNTIWRKEIHGLYRTEDVRRNLVSALGNAHLKAAPPTVISWPGTLPV